MNKISIIVIACFHLFMGCNPNEKTNTQQATTKESEEMTKLNYLALGDSYTIGEAVEENERWPVVLAEKLKAKGGEVNSPKIIAKTGWTTDELKEAIQAENLQEKYDLVSLLIGVNNQYRGEAKGYDTLTYRKEFEELLQTAIDFARQNKEKVFVVSIPDYGVTPFIKDEAARPQIAHELDIYNAINREISENYGVKYFDITTISKNAASDSSLVASDGLHPSAEMYKQWVDLMLEDVLEIVKTK